MAAIIGGGRRRKKGPQSPNFQDRDCLDFFSSSSQDPQIHTTQVQVQQRIKAAKTEACLRSKYRRAAHQFDGQKPAISGSQLLSLEGKFTSIPYRPLPLREGSSSSKENHHLPATKSLRRKPKFCNSSTAENVPETSTPTPKRKPQNRISKSVTNLRGEHERGKDTMMSPSYYRRHQHEVGTSNNGHDCWTKKFEELALRGGGGAGSINHLPLSTRASVHFQDDGGVEDLLDAAGEFGMTPPRQDAMTMIQNQGVYSPPRGTYPSSNVFIHPGYIPFRRVSDTAAAAAAAAELHCPAANTTNVGGTSCGGTTRFRESVYGISSRSFYECYGDSWA